MTLDTAYASEVGKGQVGRFRTSRELVDLWSVGRLGCNLFMCCWMLGWAYGLSWGSSGGAYTNIGFYFTLVHWRRHSVRGSPVISSKFSIFRISAVKYT